MKFRNDSNVRLITLTLLSLVLLLRWFDEDVEDLNFAVGPWLYVEGKKPSRASSTIPRASSSKSSTLRSRRLEIEEDEDDDDFEDPYFLEDSDEEEEDSMEEDDEFSDSRSKRRNSKSSRRSPPSRSPKASRYEEQDLDEDEYYEDNDREDRRASNPRSRPLNRERGPPSSPRRSSSSANRSKSRSQSRYSKRRPPPSRRKGHMVPYTQHRESTFSRGLTALRDNLPDPNVVKTSALSAMSVAKERTTQISKGLYREAKGLTSSELEQVMLKATRPDDTPVKGKHVERLVGVTYQISGRHEIYEAVLRKLWKKMSESDWRTKIKSLYVLHRFSSDGAPDHQASLKARLRELRRTRDPKTKGKYFNSKRLLHTTDGTPENVPFRAFLARYAHYVLLRVQCFGGLFADISLENELHHASSSKSTSKSSILSKPMTSTGLRTENLEGAILLLKAGCATALKDGEDCQHTAIAMERVATDMLSMTSAVATALNRALKNPNDKLDKALIQKWCEFYAQELVPKSKAFVKKTSMKLDKYGLFLPTRIGASVKPDLLTKGLAFASSSTTADDSSSLETTHENLDNTSSSENQQSFENEKEKEPDNEDDEEEHEEEHDTDAADDDDIVEDDAVEVENNNDDNEEVEEEEEYDYEDEEYYDEE